MQLHDIVGMVTRLAILGNLPLIGDVPHAAATVDAPSPSAEGHERPPMSSEQSLEPAK
jgi:hypothetical protein